MKLLVVTPVTIDAQRLADALPDGVDPHDAEVMLVAPALQENGLKFWFSDADQAISRAKQVESESVQQLSADGVEAQGDTGESDPVQAIQDALITFPADRIVMFTRGGEDGRYRDDVDPQAVRERFGLPVELAHA